MKEKDEIVIAFLKERIKKKDDVLKLIPKLKLYN